MIDRLRVLMAGLLVLLAILACNAGGREVEEGDVTGSADLQAGRNDGEQEGGGRGTEAAEVAALQPSALPPETAAAAVNTAPPTDTAVALIELQPTAGVTEVPVTAGSELLTESVGEPPPQDTQAPPAATSTVEALQPLENTAEPLLASATAAPSATPGAGSGAAQRAATNTAEPAPTDEPAAQPAPVIVAPTQPALDSAVLVPPAANTQPLSAPTPTLGILRLILRETPTPVPPSPTPAPGGFGTSGGGLTGSTLYAAAVSCLHIRNLGCGIVQEQRQTSAFSFPAGATEDVCLAWIEVGGHSDTPIVLQVQRGQEPPVGASWAGVGGSICRYVRVAGVTADSYTVDLQYLDQYIRRLTFDVENN